MSVNFPTVDLFWTIYHNDLEKLDDAILFIGSQVHHIKVWMNLTSIKYAARLGHLEQVHLLLKDLEKYVSKQSLSSRLVSVFMQAYCDSNLEFLEALLEKYPDLKFPDYDIGLCGENHIFAKDGVSNSLLAIVLEHRDLLPRILKDCVERGNRECFLILHENSLIDHEEEDCDTVHSPSRPPKIDPLAKAILMGNVSEFSQLLQELFSPAHENDLDSLPYVYPVYSHSGRYDKFHVSRRHHTVKSVFQNGTTNSVKGVAKLVIQTDDIDLFKILILPSNIQKLAQTKLRLPSHVKNVKDPNTTKKEILEALFSLALGVEGVKIIGVIIEMIRSENILDLHAVDWDLIYFTQLAQGRLKSAAAIECLRRSPDRKMVSIWSQYRNLITNVFPLIKQQREATVLERLVAELEPFIRKLPDSDNLWRELLLILCKMPLEKGRPDLVEPFRKYGIQYTESYVLSNMNGSPHRRYDEVVMPYDGQDESESWDLFPDWSRDKIRKSPQLISSSSLTPFYLGREGKHEMKLDKFIKLTEKGRAVLTECVAQSVRPLPFIDISSLHHQETKEFLEELERVRLSSFTLQELCRQKVRSTVRDATINRLSSAILSLYTNGYVPKRLVKYLLYREDHLANPLYHLLVDFVDCYYYEQEELSYIDEPR